MNSSGQILADGLVAGVIAGAVSGAPSTIIALRQGEDPLAASLAAGTLLLPREQQRVRLLLAAGGVHAALSIGWALVLAVALPRHATARWSIVAGCGIAGLDLGVIGRRFACIRALRPIREASPWHWLLQTDPLRHGLLWEAWLLPILVSVVWDLA